MTIKVPCGVAYDSDLDFVEQVTLEVAWEITQKVDNTVTKNQGYFSTPLMKAALISMWCSIAANLRISSS